LLVTGRHRQQVKSRSIVIIALLSC
jgi:hypothetical protein